MITILGASGAIGNKLLPLLINSKLPFRLVSRNPKPTNGTEEVMTADLTDQSQTIAAVAGSSVVFLLVGIQYDYKLWHEVWPKLMANVIEACKRTKARLLFFDNVYMYGKVNGTMTEDTPFQPCSKKGEVRAKIATSLIEAWKSESLTGMIARSADFYGPNTQNSMPNLLVFEPLSKRKAASWLVDDTVPHSLTYTQDAATALLHLVSRESSWNQTWHLPTAPHPPTGKELIELAAQEFGVPAKYRVLSRPLLKIGGWFDPLVRESYEMLYQNDSPYLFDSSKYKKAFGFGGTPYSEGVRATTASYKSTL